MPTPTPYSNSQQGNDFIDRLFDLSHIRSSVPVWEGYILDLSKGPYSDPWHNGMDWLIRNHWVTSPGHYVFIRLDRTTGRRALPDLRCVITVHDDMSISTGIFDEGNTSHSAATSVAATNITTWPPKGSR